LGTAPLGAWLEQSARLEGPRLATALELCAAEDIQTVGELREVHDKNPFRQLGVKAVALGRIEDALEDVPGAQPRRAQEELAEGSCTDIEAASKSVPRLKLDDGVSLPKSNRVMVPAEPAHAPPGFAALLVGDSDPRGVVRRPPNFTLTKPDAGWSHWHSGGFFQYEQTFLEFGTWKLTTHYPAGRCAT
jgi:hypothetical protein